MGKAGRALVFLTEDEVIEINRRMISHFGGIYFPGDNNLSNPGSLRYLVQAIQGSVFGRNLHPSVFDKAAALAFEIITAHVFHDGNKRTGVEACRLFLELNGWSLSIEGSIVDVALQVEARVMTRARLAQWLKSRCRRA